MYENFLDRMKISYQFVLSVIFTNLLFAQLSHNIFSTQPTKTPNFTNSYKWNQDDHLYQFEIRDSTIIGLDLNAKYSNQAVDYYENYNDAVQYQLSPFLHYTTFPNITFDLRVNIENVRDKYVYAERTFWGDEFFKHRGFYDVAKIDYRIKYFL